MGHVSAVHIMAAFVSCTLTGYDAQLRLGGACIYERASSSRAHPIPDHGSDHQKGRIIQQEWQQECRVIPVQPGGNNLGSPQVLPSGKNRPSRNQRTSSQHRLTRKGRLGEQLPVERVPAGHMSVVLGTGNENAAEKIHRLHEAALQKARNYHDARTPRHRDRIGQTSAIKETRNGRPSGERDRYLAHNPSKREIPQHPSQIYIQQQADHEGLPGQQSSLPDASDTSIVNSLEGAGLKRRKAVDRFHPDGQQTPQSRVGFAKESPQTLKGGPHGPGSTSIQDRSYRDQQKAAQDSTVPVVQHAPGVFLVADANQQSADISKAQWQNVEHPEGSAASHDQLPTIASEDFCARQQDPDPVQGGIDDDKGWIKQSIDEVQEERYSPGFDRVQNTGDSKGQSNSNDNQQGSVGRNQAEQSKNSTVLQQKAQPEEVDHAALPLRRNVVQNEIGQQPQTDGSNTAQAELQIVHQNPNATGKTGAQLAQTKHENSNIAHHPSQQDLEDPNSAGKKDSHQIEENDHAAQLPDSADELQQQSSDLESLHQPQESEVNASDPAEQIGDDNVVSQVINKKKEVIEQPTPQQSHAEKADSTESKASSKQPVANGNQAPDAAGNPEGQAKVQNKSIPRKQKVPIGSQQQAVMHPHTGKAVSRQALKGPKLKVNKSKVPAHEPRQAVGIPNTTRGKTSEDQLARPSQERNVSEQKLFNEETQPARPETIQPTKAFEAQQHAQNVLATPGLQPAFDEDNSQVQAANEVQQEAEPEVVSSEGEVTSFDMPTVVVVHAGQPEKSNQVLTAEEGQTSSSVVKQGSVQVAQVPPEQKSGTVARHQSPYSVVATYSPQDPSVSNEKQEQAVKNNPSVSSPGMGDAHVKPEIPAKSSPTAQGSSALSGTMVSEKKPPAADGNLHAKAQDVNEPKSEAETDGNFHLVEQAMARLSTVPMPESATPTSLLHDHSGQMIDADEGEPDQPVPEPPAREISQLTSQQVAHLSRLSKLKLGKPVIFSVHGYNRTVAEIASSPPGTQQDPRLVYSVVDISLGGGYDMGSGVFRAPVDGYYAFAWVFTMSYQQLKGPISMDIVHNNANMVGHAHLNHNREGTMSTFTRLMLKAGDEVETRLRGGQNALCSRKSKSMTPSRHRDQCYVRFYGQLLGS